MFNNVDEKRSGLQRYMRAKQFVINNPYYNEPSVQVYEEKVFTDMGTVTLIGGTVLNLPLQTVQGIGFDGNPTAQEYTVEDIALMLNSIYHVARNYVEPVVEPIVVNYDYIPKETQ